MDSLDISPKSKKAKSRIGHMCPAVVEQRHHDKMFVSFVGVNYSCWMPLDGGDDWVIFDGGDW